MKLSKQIKALLCGTCLFSLLLLPACANDAQSNTPERSSASNELLVSGTSVTSTADFSETSPDKSIWQIGGNINLFMPNGFEPIGITVLEYDGKTPMEFVLKTKVRSPNLSPDEPVKLRIWVAQQGEFLEHALEKGGTPELYHDVFVKPDTEFRSSIYFTPICETEFTPVTVFCDYLPDNLPTLENDGCGATVFYSKMIRTTAKSITPISVPEQNYITLPENDIKNEQCKGLYIGGALPAPSSYIIKDNPNLGEEKTLSPDDIYLKANFDGDGTYYAMVFVDGMPIKAFDGKYSLPVNFEGGTRTLNQKLDISDGLTGAHSFSVFLLKYETAPVDSIIGNIQASHIRINITPE